MSPSGKRTPRSRWPGDWWARWTHSAAGLYAWRKGFMTLLRRLVKQVVGYDDQSLARFDWTWRDCYRRTMRNASVLDVGCGPGDHSTEVMRFGQASRYFGVDISPGMIRSAAGSFPEHRFCVADGCELPLRDRSIDVVIACFSFHHIEQDKRAAALKELMRVARATVIVRDLMGVGRGFRGWLYQAYYSIVDGSFHRYTLREWRTLMGPAGMTQEFHTDETALVNRHCCFVITIDDTHMSH